MYTNNTNNKKIYIKVENALLNTYTKKFINVSDLYN